MEIIISFYFIIFSEIQNYFTPKPAEWEKFLNKVHTFYLQRDDLLQVGKDIERLKVEIEEMKNEKKALQEKYEEFFQDPEIKKKYKY